MERIKLVVLNIKKRLLSINKKKILLGLNIMVSICFIVIVIGTIQVASLMSAETNNTLLEQFLMAVFEIMFVILLIIIPILLLVLYLVWTAYFKNKLKRLRIVSGIFFMFLIITFQLFSSRLSMFSFLIVIVSLLYVYVSLEEKKDSIES